MWPEGAKPEQQSLSGDHLVSSRGVLRGSEARGGYFFIPRGGQGVQGVRGGWNINFLAHNTTNVIQIRFIWLLEPQSSATIYK